MLRLRLRLLRLTGGLLIGIRQLKPFLAPHFL
jgi:hypothetical protein